MPIYQGNQEIGKDYYGVSPQGRIYQGTQIVQGGYAIDTQTYAYWDASNPASYPGSGSTWFDLSGNGNNLTFTGSVVYTNNAFNFSGSYAYRYPGSSMGSGDQLTMCAWIKTPGFTQFNPRQYLTISDISGSSPMSFGLQDFNGSEYPRFFDNVFTTSGSQIIVGDNNFNTLYDNIWYLHTFIVSGSTTPFPGPGTGSIGLTPMPQTFLNGTISYRQGDPWAGGAIVLKSLPSLIVGGTDAGNDWIGEIGEIAIYNKTLSPSSVYDFYESTKYKYGY
jgi:hypothetical protein